jgi:hypothetical protein
MDSKQTGGNGVDGVHPAGDGEPVVGACDHGYGPWCSAKCLEYLE